MTKNPGVVQVGWSQRLFWLRGFLFKVSILGILNIVTFYPEGKKSRMHMQLLLDPISWTVNITSGDYELAS